MIVYDARKGTTMSKSLAAEMAAAAFELRDNLRAQTELAIKSALAEGWSGTIWAWVTMNGGHAFIHISRVEPTWPIEDLLGDVNAHEIPPGMLVDRT